MKKVLILLHGSFHTSKQWDFVKPHLLKHESIDAVLTPDWPGRTGDHKLKDPIDPSQYDKLNEEYSKISLVDYVNQLKDLILENKDRGEIHLVAHSFAAIVVQQMLATVEEVRSLVKSIIFIAGLLTGDGRSVSEYIYHDKDALFVENLISPGESGAFFGFKPDHIKEAFFNTCKNSENAQIMFDNMVLEPALPFTQKLKNNLVEFEGTQIYLETLCDKVMSPNFQRTIIAEQQEGEENDGMMVISLKCDHCPMVCCPDVLSKRLIECICHHEQDPNAKMEVN